MLTLFRKQFKLLINCFTGNNYCTFNNRLSPVYAGNKYNSIMHGLSKFLLDKCCRYSLNNCERDTLRMDLNFCDTNAA